MRTVTVFDVDLPTGVAFARSLGRAGVPTKVYSADRQAAGRFSRMPVTSGRAPRCGVRTSSSPCIAEGLTEGWIDLIAPTSDYVVLCRRRSGLEKIGVDAMTVGHPNPHAARTALFKDAFTRVRPDRLPDARNDGASHRRRSSRRRRADGLPGRAEAAVSRRSRERRGVVSQMPQRWRQRSTHGRFTVSVTLCCSTSPPIRMPLLQRYHELGTVDVISVSGYLAQDGHSSLSTIAASCRSRRGGSVWARCSSTSVRSRSRTWPSMQSAR